MFSRVATRISKIDTKKVVKNSREVIQIATITRACRLEAREPPLGRTSCCSELSIKEKRTKRGGGEPGGGVCGGRGVS